MVLWARMRQDQLVRLLGTGVMRIHLRSKGILFCLRIAPLEVLIINILHLVGTFAPLLAIASMKFFKLSNFFDGGKVVFQHLLFLAILTALYNTLMKFFVYSYLSSLGEGSQSINAMQFIKNYLIGDVLGCLSVLLFAALVIVPGIRYFAPSHVPPK